MLLVKSSIVLGSVIVLLFVQSLVESLYLGMGKFGASQKLKGQVTAAMTATTTTTTKNCIFGLRSLNCLSELLAGLTRATF